ncbi:MAG: DUF2066 domain-containing protein [Thiotrichales bacterium]|nr:DUF2066 domain-containing protein [Thiotrichales bacterium]
MTGFLLALFLAHSHTAQAATVTGLYEAEVPVSNQTAGQRQSAIRAAFIQVMVKLTGNRNAASIYGVSEMMERVDQYVQQFEYRTQDDRAGNPSTRLWVRFDPRVIDRGMRDYSIPIWSQERPSSLVWLVIRDDLGQRFASLDVDSRFFSVLQEQAGARGISFITPLYDLQDATAIRSSDIIDGIDTTIMLASSRYQPDAVLSGAITSAGAGLWEGEWLIIIQDQIINRWMNSGDSIEIVLSEAMDGLADNLAIRFAQTRGYASETIQEISVTGVSSFAAYARTLSYLESLNIVSAVDVKSMDTTRVVYVLSTAGTAETLAQTLTLGRVLEPAGNSGVYQLVQ